MVESRRRQIEDVASALFRERGYAATSVRDIAHAMNLRGASLYAHVASKEDVLWSIVRRSAERFETAAAAHAGSSIPAADRLRAMIGAHVEVIAADRGNAAVFLHEWRLLSPERRALTVEARDRYEARFVDVIEDGVREGTFTTDDPRLAATWILTALNGLATWYRPHGRLSPAAISERYAELCIGGLTGTPPRRDDP